MPDPTPSRSALPARSRVRKAILVSILASLALSVGCAKPYDPFQVPRDDVRAQVRTVAISPYTAPHSQMDAERARATFEPLVTERLEAAGLTVVPSEVWLGIHRQAAEDLGGIYDPSTGEGDEEKLELLNETLYAELANQHDVDALLFLQVKQVRLDLKRAELDFCGKSGRVNFPKREDGTGFSARGTLTGTGVGTVTLAYASCLSAMLFDMDRNFLYGIQHGLEVFDSYARQTRAKRPREERLKDPAVIEEAVETVVGPLADGYAGEE
ncbi:MAG: hypothetical protein AAGC67_11830 [Myxococcota bacterium]